MQRFGEDRFFWYASIIYSTNRLLVFHVKRLYWFEPCHWHDWICHVFFYSF